MALATPEEKPILREFRARIADLVLDDFEKHEVWAMAWLRARDLNVSKAEAMIRKSFEWRKIHKIDTLLSWVPPADYTQKFPFEISGYDNEDTPIATISVGKWDIRKAVDDGEGKTFLQYGRLLSLIMIDDAKRKERLTGKHVSQFIGIINMAGFSMRQITSMACIEIHMESVRDYEDNYPETLKSAFVVNAPRIFAILFNIVKPLLSAHTLSKIQIFDSNEAKWKEALLNNIPASQLPVEYGGTKKSLIQFDPKNEALFGTEERLVKVVISPGKHFSLEFNVLTLYCTISWKFKTEHFDIGFCIKDRLGNEVVAYRRVEASKSLQEGSYVAEKNGKYTLVFDNHYSKLRCKNLHYFVTMKKPVEPKFTL